VGERGRRVREHAVDRGGRVGQPPLPSDGGHPSARTRRPTSRSTRPAASDAHPPTSPSDNPALQKSTTKTVAAFLNSSGGRLIVGVDDDGSLRGLELDYRGLPRSGAEGRDRFLQAIANAVNQHLGPGVTPLVKMEIIEVDGSDVCLIHVRRSPTPVYLKEANDKDEFYVRLGSTSRALNHQDALRYVRSQWG